MAILSAPGAAGSHRFLPEYRTIWRWHFYAGLFCIPFVLWLATTGSLYLFKPQIERWLDEPYAHVVPAGAARAPAEAQVNAALAAVPGSNLHFYELPRSDEAAVQIVVGRGTRETRVYVNPASLRILKVQNEDRRPMEMVFHLHGELLMGDRGSVVIETAASWAIIMILTGLVLWWPKQTRRLAGVLYPRLRQSGRTFWRDVHAVTGAWASVFILAFLLTGLPWAKSWGTYLKWARGMERAPAGALTWTTGRASELAQRLARDNDPSTSMGMAMDMGGQRHAGGTGGIPITPVAYAAIDRVLPVADSLRLAFPVQISPPTKTGKPWIVASNAQNRTLRDQVSVDGTTAAIVGRTGFAQRAAIDRLVALGISVHEGHLFGWLNQLMNLMIALSVATLALTAAVMWWRRRPVGVLGAPPPNERTVVSAGLVLVMAALSVYLPFFGLTLIGVLLIERLLLRRLPAARRWLGLPEPVTRAAASA